MDFAKLKKYYIDNRLIFNCGLLAILFFVNCFVADFSYLVFFVLMVGVLFENKQNSFSMLVFSVPFCGIDEYLGVYLLFACVAIFIIKNYIIMRFFDKLKVNWFVVCSIFMFLIYALLPIGEYSQGLFVKLIIIFSIVLLVNLFINYKGLLNLKFNLNVMAIGLIISAAFYLTYFISPYMNSKPIPIMTEDFIRFAALLMNPNALAMICEICLSLLTIYLIQDKFEWNDIIAYIIFAVLGLSTFSKTFLILFGILAIILFVYLIRKYKWKIAWLVCVICGLVMFAVIIKGDFLFAYLRRFVNINLNDNYDTTFGKFLNVLTTGRYKLWSAVLSYMFMNPIVIFFGRGLGAPLVASLSAHNFYITMIYELGIVGSILFVLMFVALILDYKKHNPDYKFKKAYLIPIIIIGLLMMVEDLFLYIY